MAKLIMDDGTTFDLPDSVVNLLYLRCPHCEKWMTMTTKLHREKEVEGG